jgi:hypothetical protein
VVPHSDLCGGTEWYTFAYGTTVYVQVADAKINKGNEVLEFLPERLLVFV